MRANLEVSTDVSGDCSQTFPGISGIVLSLVVSGISGEVPG